MNWDEIKANWHIYKGKAKAKWDKLSDETLSKLEGSRDALMAKRRRLTVTPKSRQKVRLRSFAAAQPIKKRLLKNPEKPEPPQGIQRRAGADRLVVVKEAVWAKAAQALYYTAVRRAAS
jgi:hypothetical protein